MKYSALCLGIVLALAGQASALDCTQVGGATAACPASDTYCFSAFMYKNNSAAPTSGLPNMTAYSALPALGCHNSTVAALNIICPVPANANRSTLVPASVASYGLLSVVGDTAYYYTCCNETTCTAQTADTPPPTTTPEDEQTRDEEEVVSVVELTEVPKPPTIVIGFLNLILLGVITFFAFFGGFLVDIADTNRLIFKEA